MSFHLLRGAPRPRRLATLALRALEDRCTPANLVVTSAADAGAGSLRAVIATANTNGEADTITFDASITTINLTTGQLTISESKNLSIDGGGKVTINGAAAASTTNRLFNLTASGQPTIAFQNITLAKGNLTAGGGAAIQMTSQTLQLIGATISSNSVGGLGAGAGIYSKSTVGGTLVVNGSTIANNVISGDGQGAGIYMSNGTLTISNSTICSNVVSDVGFYRGGGGLYLGNCSTTISNSTIANNTANSTGSLTGGGGLYIRNGSILIRNSTIAKNVAPSGGGIYVADGLANIHIDSTIVAANTGGDSPDVDLTTNHAIVGSHNLFGVLDFPPDGDNDPALMGSLKSPVNPGLLPLGNYGGPTQTMGLVYTSPAIDKGSNPGSLATDQRGQPREAPAGLPDIGAVEGTVAVPFVDTVAALSSITAPTAAPYTIAVTYDSAAGIDTSSLDDGDIVVTGPQPVGPITLQGFTVSGERVTATYQFTPPGGLWGVLDNGTYTVTLATSQVLDTSSPANSVAPQTLQTITVSTPSIIRVDNTTDIVDGNFGSGQLSLREAVLLANGLPSTTDTITFDPVVFGSQKTIVLGSELAITSSLVIAGPGESLLTLSGNNGHRLINATDVGTGQTSVTVGGMTLANGLGTAGGAILNKAHSLTLTDCTIRDCIATGNGGAVSSNPFGLTLVRCHLHDNHATNGGAIDNYGVTITDCVISGNSASAVGGGLFSTYAGVRVTRTTISANVAAYGGGVAVNFGPYSETFDNCTISDNIATISGGGFYLTNYKGPVRLNNSTVTANSAGVSGGGIFNNSSTGSVELKSAIVAGNSSANNPDFSFVAATNITGNHNLVGVANAGNVTFTGAGNLTGTLSSPLNPMLSPLAANGGPTMTHLPLLGSPAIDAGDNDAGFVTDQRGLKRVSGPAADIGAVELASPIPIAVVGTFINVFPNYSGPYFVTVRYFDETGQIDASTINAGNLTVLGPNLFNVAPTLVNTVVTSANVTATYQFDPPTNAAPGWDSSDNGTYTIKLNSNSVFDLDVPTPHAVPGRQLGTFTVKANANLVVNATNDELINSDGKMSLREAVALANAIPANLDTIVFDPVVFAAPQTIDLARSGLGPLTISGATTIVGPGADRLTLLANPQQYVIYVSNAKVTLTDLTISGGQFGIRAYDSPALSLERLAITANGTAGGGGGGLDISTGTIASIRDCAITGNTGTYAGLVLGGTAAYLSNCIIAGNTSTGEGGGIYSATRTLTMVNTTVTLNSAGTGGGAYFAAVSSAVIEGCVFADNSASIGPDIAGGIYPVPMQNCFVGIVDDSVQLNDLGGNTFGSSALPADAKLGAINSIGGRAIVEVLPGSPLIDKAANAGILTFDERGSGFLRTIGMATDIGAIEGTSVLPAARMLPAPTVVSPGPSPNTITVAYRGGSGIDTASINTSNIVVRGPGGIAASVTGVAVTISGGKTLATYTFVPPGGAWSGDDAGDYTISVSANSVFDAAPTPHSVPATTLGGFRVSLPATFTVDEATDIDDGNYSVGHQSFREALNRANADPLTEDTIVFNPSAFPVGTRITNASYRQFSWFNIATPINIIGPGPDRLTLDANNYARAINIGSYDYDMDPVELSGMTITQGRALDANGSGGGIFAQGVSVVLSNINIYSNHAGGSGGGLFVGYTATVTVRDSIIQGNGPVATYQVKGGGIAIDRSPTSRLVIENSVITGNTSNYYGAGVYLGQQGTLRMTDCLITDNTSTNSGGIGGGIFAYGRCYTSFVRNTTISGNTAGKGGGIGMRYPYGYLEVSNCTISDNKAVLGGGIARYTNVGKFYHGTGSFLLTSNIIAGNTASSAGNDAWCDASITIGGGGHNLIGIANDGLVTFSGSNLLGTKATPLDAKLGPLADYGGPTKTYALLPGSPALNAGINPSGLATDQRGYLRSYGSAADIGAYESQPPRVTSVIVNDGSAQRSRITSITVNFDSTVAVPANSFRLQRQSDGQFVDVYPDISVGGPTTSVTLTFGGPLTDFGSLQDGRYSLTVLANQVSNFVSALDGNADGAPGDDYVLVGSPANGLFSLFGDADGNGVIDGLDYAAFRTAFNTNNSIFSFDGTGPVDGIDFGQFRMRFGVMI